LLFLNLNNLKYFIEQRCSHLTISANPRHLMIHSISLTHYSIVTCLSVFVDNDIHLATTTTTTAKYPFNTVMHYPDCTLQT
jgi:hypothetical protein